MEGPDKIRLVILSTATAAAVLGDVWKKYGPEPFRLLTVDQDESLKDILLERIIADPEIDDRFILAPANMIPCSRISLEELSVPTVYVFNEQETFWGKTPVLFDKNFLESFLPENDSLPDNDFVKKYLKSFATRPLQVSYQWGNYVTPVLRADPCWAKVAEAMVRKKFLFANQVGFNAIVSQINKVLL